MLAGTFLALLLAYAYTTARYGHAASTADAHLYYLHARSWYFDRDCDYTNDLRADPTFRARDYYLAPRSTTGRAVNIFPCGWSIIALPFVALADGFTLAHNTVLSAALPRDGFSFYYRVVVPFGHVCLGIAGLYAAYALTARYFSRTLAAWAVLLVCAGTNVSYFIAVDPTMAHAASMGCVSVTIWLADTIRRQGWTLGRSATLGLAAGLMLAVRFQDVAWLVTPLVLLVPMPRRGGHGGARGGEDGPAHDTAVALPVRQRLRGAGSAVLGPAVAILLAAACLVPQVLVNLQNTGLPGGHLGALSPAWLHPHLIRDFFDARGGLFVLFPLTAACAAGVLAFTAAQRDRFAGALTLGLVACVYLNACGAEGASRRFTCCLVSFVLGLATVLYWARLRRARAIFVAAMVSVAVARNITLNVLVDRGVVDRYAFTSVPDAPQAVLGRLAGGG
ncbi:MAG: hypothetical protein HY763_02460 [Planctomycetes bacterium]|nr:hypothetical protein [Planctomycetota bacterium]